MQQPQGHRLEELMRCPFHRVLANGIDRDLPGERVPNLAALFGQQPYLPKAVLLFGERQAGSFEVLQRWHRRLGEQSLPAALLHDRAMGHSWTAAACTGTPVDEGHETMLRGFLDGARGLGELRAYLKGHMALPLVVMLRRLEFLAPQVDQRLRAAADEGVLVPVAIVADERLVREAPEASSLLTIADAYRLPSYTVDAVRALAPSLDVNQAQDALESTGGQLVLTGRLLDALPNGSSRTTPSQLKQALASLHRSPPPIVEVWKQALRALLNDEPALAEGLRRFVEGKYLVPGRPDYPPPSRQRALYVSGWLGVTRLGWWGIRSDLHRAWAREVLHDMGDAR